MKFLFGCKCVFEHKGKSPSGKAGHRFYEEQIFVVKATNSSNARKMALKIAKEQVRKDVIFHDLIGVYFPLDQSFRDGAEIFCSFRESKLKPKQYIRSYFKSLHDYEVGSD